MQFASRLDKIETSAIRELFKLLGQPGIISFAGGFPDGAMFDVEGIREAAARALASPGSALQYGATEGHPPLRAALADFMRGKGVDVAADGLIVTTGSQQALDLVGKTLISSGDRVVVEAPTFLATIQCFRLYGAEVLGAAIDADGVDPDAVERLIVERGARLVYLIPTFGNPSGATLSLERRLRLLQLAVQHDVTLVEDDPYGDLYFDTPPPPPLLALAAQVPGARDHIVYCGSLSKVLSPGLRLGWMIAPPAMLARATMCKQFSDAHTSTFAQATAAEYLAAGRMPATLARVREAYGTRAAAMGRALTGALGDALAFTPPRGGLFVWARLTGAGGTLTDAGLLARRAVEEGVAFVPGAPFFAEAPDAATLRLSFATAEPAQIEEGVQRLTRALQRA